MIQYNNQNQRANPSQEALLSEPIISFNQFDENRAWDLERIQEVLPLIKEWHVSQFQLCNTFIMKIQVERTIFLESISHITFSGLRDLVISCDMVTAEVLSQINMPKIRTIGIYGNFICSMKTLRKANWPELRGGFFCFNPLVDPQKFSEMRIFQAEKFGAKCVTYPTFCWMAKLESNKLEKLWLKDARIKKYECIKHENLESSLKKKYRQLIIPE